MHSWRWESNIEAGFSLPKYALGGSKWLAACCLNIAHQLDVYNLPKAE